MSTCSTAYDANRHPLASNCDVPWSFSSIVSFICHPSAKNHYQSWLKQLFQQVGRERGELVFQIRPIVIRRLRLVRNQYFFLIKVLYFSTIEPTKLTFEKIFLFSLTNTYSDFAVKKIESIASQFTWVRSAWDSSRNCIPIKITRANRYKSRCLAETFREKPREKGK